VLILKSIYVKNIDGLIDYRNDDSFNYNNMVIDSRILAKNDAFVGLKGIHVDGNEYALDALRKGASFIIVDDENVYRKLYSKKILVKDSLKALKNIGSLNINNFNGLKIAVTGSAGKTSTKELIHTILSEKYLVYKNFKNNNNALGLALNCANLDLNSDIAVFECGSNSKGEIKELSKYLLPHIAVITNIGYSHIGRFGSIEELAKEKLSITIPTSVKELWINLDEYSKYKHLIDKKINIKTFSYNPHKEAYICINKVELVDNEIHLEVLFNKMVYQFKLNHFFIHFAYDALPAIGIAFDHGLNESLINKGLLEFVPLTGRGQIISYKNLKIIDDTYNASYDSIIAALNSLSLLKGHKIAIIGTMAEIEGHEEALYNKLYNYMVACDSIYYILVGDEYMKFTQNNHIKFVKNKGAAIELIKNYLKNQNITYTVLLKGARKNAFEEILASIINRGEIRSVI
jgi:UDP-N-acetylmuramoyl-tripeptide--D-alanyl-D-alanine ligase